MIIEIYICQYLNRVSGTPAFGEIPKQAPDSFFVVEKLGSGRENLIDSATIAVQSYAPSLLEAARLNEVIKDSMLDIVTLDAVASIRLNSDYNYTDMATKSYRYQAVFDIVAYDD